MTGCVTKHWSPALNRISQLSRLGDQCWSRQRVGLSKLRVARRPGEGNHVANILHPREVHHHSLEAHPETRVLDAAEPAQVEIPPVRLFLHSMCSHFANAIQQQIVPLLALA